MQLAYGSKHHPLGAQTVDLTLASSEYSANMYRDSGICTNVVVVGDPSLDTLPVWDPQPNHVLALTTVSNETPDKGQQLRSAATCLITAGWEVTVRTHPREPKSNWDDFSLDTHITAAQSAADKSAVIGYPGTAFAQLAAIGVPLVALVDKSTFITSIPAPYLDVATLLKDPNLAVSSVCQAKTPDQNLVATLTGPIGGSAQRIWSHIQAATNFVST